MWPPQYVVQKARGGGFIFLLWAPCLALWTYHGARQAWALSLSRQPRSRLNQNSSRLIWENSSGPSLGQQTNKPEPSPSSPKLLRPPPSSNTSFADTISPTDEISSAEVESSFSSDDDDDDDLQAAAEAKTEVPRALKQKSRGFQHYAKGAQPTLSAAQLDQLDQLRETSVENRGQGPKKAGWMKRLREKFADMKRGAKDWYKYRLQEIVGEIKERVREYIQGAAERRETPIENVFVDKASKDWLRQSDAEASKEVQKASEELLAARKEVDDRTEAEGGVLKSG